MIYDEKPIGIRGILIDITERKNKEIKLKESEETYRILSENSDDLISLYDEKFRMIYINAESHSRVLGYPAKKFLKLTFKMIITHKDDIIPFNNIVKKGIEEGNYRYQIRFKHQKGHYLWFQITAKFFSVDLEKKKLLVVAREITDIKQAEKNLKESEEELIKLNKLKSELFVRTSHELKTPLQSIKGFSDLLLTYHRSKLDDYSISKITAIKNGADRLQKLIGDILKAAELESGYTKIKSKNDNLSNLINVCVKEVQGFADLRKHQIELDVEPNLITNFEREQIHKVVSNLLNNAIKYTPPNGKIEINSNIKNNLILTSIKDNGIGFAREEIQMVFKQFGKIKRFGQNLQVIPDGTGLGLFISKKIVELHGGEIWVESEGRNQGSTFYFTLPITQD